MTPEYDALTETEGQAESEPVTESEVLTESEALTETDGHIDCAQALERVYQFLDQEIDDASGDTIRRHLAECEPCLDRFDVEGAVKALVNRCCSSETAPEDLRSKVLQRISIAREAAVDES